MNDHEIRIVLSELLQKHVKCGGDQHMLIITKTTIEMQHGYHLLHGFAKTIKLTGEQVQQGFTPSEWSSLTRRCVRAQLEAER